MGLAPGGRMKQDIYDDPYGLDAWGQRHGSRCFVSLLNTTQWMGTTAERPPTWPPTAQAYAASDLPWFDYYGGDLQAVAGSEKLRGLAKPAPGGRMGRDGRAHRDAAVAPGLGRDEADAPQVELPVLPGEAESLWRPCRRTVFSRRFPSTGPHSPRQPGRPSRDRVTPHNARPFDQSRCLRRIPTSTTRPGTPQTGPCRIGHGPSYAYRRGCPFRTNSRSWSAVACGGSRPATQSTPMPSSTGSCTMPIASTERQIDAKYQHRSGNTAQSRITMSPSRRYASTGR